CCTASRGQEDISGGGLWRDSARPSARRSCSARPSTRPKRFASANDGRSRPRVSTTTSTGVRPSASIRHRARCLPQRKKRNRTRKSPMRSPRRSPRARRADRAASRLPGLKSRTTKGAAYGTGVGAAAGAAIGGILGGGEGAWKGAAVGAAVGGLSGGALGYYMDSQAKEMQQVVARQDRVEREGDTLRVSLASDVLFDSGSATLQPGAQDKLHQVAQVLERY